jgi:pilus assembly protein CpaE
MTDVQVVAIGPPLTFRHQVARAMGREADAIQWVPTVAAVEGSLGSGQSKPNVLVLSPSVKEQDAFGLAEFVGRSSPATAVLLVRDQPMNGLLPAAMRAGIRDVVDLARGSEDLREALERALAWSQSIRSIGGMTAESPEQPRSRVFAVFSSKGGTGKTFLATNLAVAIARESKQDTALVDLDLDLGDVFSYFGKEPSRPLQDLLMLDESSAVEAVREIGTKCDDHLWAFAAPPDPSAEGIGGQAMSQAIRTLRGAFDYIVIDATADYSDPALAAFDLSEQIFLITGLDVVGVRHLALALQTLQSLGYPRERFRIVLNRADSKVGLSSADVERVMNVKVDAMIPSSRLVPVSLNRGTPVVMEQPRSGVARSVQALARRVVEPVAAGGKRRMFAKH